MTIVSTKIYYRVEIYSLINIKSIFKRFFFSLFVHIDSVYQFRFIESESSARKSHVGVCY